jgi:hypothetical protein
MSGTLPIIYIRGFAGDTEGIDRAVVDPLYGFNTGSTHVRVNGEGDAVFYQFESPVLRLIAEHHYQLLVHGGQEAFLESQPDGEVDAETIWIHRFYDRSSSQWTRAPAEFDLKDAAVDLLRLTELVLAKTGADRVHLVAHSMGGLIARCMIQKVIPEAYAETPGPGGRSLAAYFVDRLFTYGTPHGGIEFELGFGLIERFRDATGFKGADIFGPKKMYQYLTPGANEDASPPEKWDAREMPNDANFPLKRVFCLVGTNAGDYAVGGGWSARSVGPRSDGLVQIENALVSSVERNERRSTADHAFVHRSHSGLLGMVNSEEGYHNLSRFLLGDVRVTAELQNLTLPHDDELTWQVEAQVSIRGLPTLMHERTAANHCPILIEKPTTDDPADRPIPMVTTYLCTGMPRPTGNPYMRFTLRIRLLSLREEGGFFKWGEHLEQTTDFDDTLVIDVKEGEASIKAWAQWASALTGLLRDYAPDGDPLTDKEPDQDIWVADIPLPKSGRFLGSNAAVRLTCRPADSER